MIQFYFLSVALNLVCGLALVLPDRSHQWKLLDHLDAILSDAGLRGALGVLGVVTGALTIISPIQGDVPFVGDLIPSFTSALAGLVLLLELRSDRQDKANSASPEGTSEAPGQVPSPSSRRKLRGVLVESGRIIGLFAILAGLAHFLFPLELFL